MSSINLPSRPLTTEELYALHQSEQFIEVTPVNMIIDEDGDGQSLALDGVFVTGDRIIALQYDVEDKEWECVFQKDNNPEKAGETVAREVVAEAREVLEDTVERLQSKGLAGDVIDAENIDEGRAVTREADALTELVRHHYHEATSE